MPDVTIDPGEYERYELKTAPPDGYIMLRPLPFGMKLARRSKATRTMMRMPAPSKANQGKKIDQSMEIESMDEVTTLIDFSYCIGDHNLTDKNGEKLDFTNKMTLKLLNPKVGSEIERLISELNEDEDEESLEDFLGRSTGPSEDEIGSLETDGNGSPITPTAEEATT
jgi:hypothetical protein